MTDRPSAHAHLRVRDVAVAMAHELYDHLMRDDQFYRMWQLQNPGLTKRQLEEAFVAKNLSKLIPQARATLAGMIGRYKDDPEMQEAIYEALTLDATLIRGRAN